MSRTLARKDPAAFKTQPLQVRAAPDMLSYRSLGLPLNFSQTLARRKPVSIDNCERFEVELANLGVSVRLTLNWQGRDYWVLVRQRREDRGDDVLKLISGYVPAHEINLPLLTAIQEVAEECLLETPDGWLAGRYGETWMPTPYEPILRYRESPVFRLTPLSGSARTVRCGEMPLLERPRAYVHLPTASLQLVYDMRMELGADIRQLSLFHAEDQLIEDQLQASLDRQHPDLFLLPLRDGKPLPQLLTLRHGELKPAGLREPWLSESFAAQDGWVVRDERIHWDDWCRRIETPAQPLAS